MNRANVDGIWQDEIQPLLETFETERAAAINAFWQRAPLGFLLGITLTRLAVPAWSWFVAFVLGALVAAIFAARPVARLHALSRRIKAALLERIAAALGYEYALHPDARLKGLADQLAPTHLLPPFTNIRIEDHFTGTSHGRRVEWFEAHLTDLAKRDGTAIPFQGVIMRIEMLRPVAGRTYILPVDTIAPEDVWRELPEAGDLKIISLGNPVFERVFQVVADDEIYSRYMLTPSFMERLLELRQITGLADMRASFLTRGRRGEFVLTLETPDHYELSSWHTPVPDRDDVRRVVHEISLVHAIADVITEPAVESDDVQAMLARNPED